METKVKESLEKSERTLRKTGLPRTGTTLAGIIISFMFILPFAANAHCDSYDGPVIQDAYKALETNNGNLVLKWISPEQEKEIISLFNKTYNLRNGDKEIYQIVEKHFLETLVRLHRETEGAPYTGLKDAGSTKKIIELSDRAIESRDIESLSSLFTAHVGKVLKEKYDHVASLYPQRDISPDKGRAFVKSYVDYTHTLEAIHDILESGGGHGEHKH